MNRSDHPPRAPRRDRGPDPCEPGAPNVIPGRVVMSLEIRDLAAENIEGVRCHRHGSGRIAAARQTPITLYPAEGFASTPAPTHERMQPDHRQGLREGPGPQSTVMPSGAGHDAQDMTHIAPTGMIFVPSAFGVSHSPKEYTSPEDMANGANVCANRAGRRRWRAGRSLDRNCSGRSGTAGRSVGEGDRQPRSAAAESTFADPPSSSRPAESGTEVLRRACP